MTDFTSEDLLEYIFGSRSTRDRLTVKIVEAMNTKLDRQLVEWRKAYDQIGEVAFITSMAHEFNRQDPDAIRGVCVALLVKIVREVKIDAEGTDSGRTGDATGSNSNEQ